MPSRALTRLARQPSASNDPVPRLPGAAAAHVFTVDGPEPKTRAADSRHLGRAGDDKPVRGVSKGQFLLVRARLADEKAGFRNAGRDGMAASNCINH
jgi:hypothetical protein